MKKILFVMILFSVSFLMNAQTEVNEKLFDPTRNPFDDLKSTIEVAQNTNKRIILDIGGDWCVWCHRIDAFMNNTVEVKSTLDENFIVLKINVSKENKNEKFLAQYPTIEGYPHFFVLEKDGTLLHSQNTGELEKDKDYDSEKFISFLNKWKLSKK